jgi:hypothetical protein
MKYESQLVLYKAIQGVKDRIDSSVAVPEVIIESLDSFRTS